MEKETDMSDLDPADYENGQLVNSRPAAVPVSEVAVAAGETVNSADPSITLGPGKAISAALTGLGLTVLVGAINAITPELFEPLGPWGAVLYAGIVAGGATLATYVTRTTVTGNGH